MTDDSTRDDKRPWPRCVIHLEGPRCTQPAGHEGDHVFAPTDPTRDDERRPVWSLAQIVAAQNQHIERLRQLIAQHWPDGTTHGDEYEARLAMVAIMKCGDELLAIDRQLAMAQAARDTARADADAAEQRAVEAERELESIYVTADSGARATGFAAFSLTLASVKHHQEQLAALQQWKKETNTELQDLMLHCERYEAERTALRAEVTRLRKILQPIAAWHAINEEVHNGPDHQPLAYPTTYGEMRRLRDALAGSGGLCPPTAVCPPGGRSARQFSVCRASAGRSRT